MACWILMDDHEADGGIYHTDVGSWWKVWPPPPRPPPPLKFVLTPEQTGKIHG